MLLLQVQREPETSKLSRCYLVIYIVYLYFCFLSLKAGEDGYVKIWSRSGMLRSTVISSDSSVYSACWSPDSQAISYIQGKFIVVKQLAPNTKPVRVRTLQYPFAHQKSNVKKRDFLQWKGGDGLILCLAWSSISELIVSGGEDLRYRVWDSQGRPIFSSTLHDHPITSVAWSPNGDLFSMGSYNTLRLCDALGVSLPYIFIYTTENLFTL